MVAPSLFFFAQRCRVRCLQRQVLERIASFRARSTLIACLPPKAQLTGLYSYSKRDLVSTVGLRRARQYKGPHDAAGNMPRENFGKLQEPYQHDEADLDSYLKKTSLSPWVPLPDVVARRALEIAEAGPEDLHVDLGSGDGRVCFHALQYGVASSVGIDIDENMIKLAKERMVKRHPAPPNLFFMVADLLDPNHKEAWKHLQEASLITMYFATPALEKLRPLLEQKLVGRTCKIVTCGYEMPGWESVVQEVVLGTQIHLYQWGQVDRVEDKGDFLFVGDDILKETPEGLMMNSLGNNKFQGSNVIDRTGRYPIRGFNPAIFEEEENDEDFWNVSSDDEDDNKEDNQAERKEGP